MTVTLSSSEPGGPPAAGPAGVLAPYPHQPHGGGGQRGQPRYGACSWTGLQCVILCISGALTHPFQTPSCCGSPKTVTYMKVYGIYEPGGLQVVSWMCCLSLSDPPQWTESRRTASRRETATSRCPRTRPSSSGRQGGGPCSGMLALAECDWLSGYCCCSCCSCCISGSQCLAFLQMYVLAVGGVWALPIFLLIWLCIYQCAGCLCHWFTISVTFCLIIIKARWLFWKRPWMINQWAFPNVYYGNGRDISLIVPIVV